MQVWCYYQFKSQIKNATTSATTVNFLHVVLADCVPSEGVADYRMHLFNVLPPPLGSLCHYKVVHPLQ